MRKQITSDKAPPVIGPYSQAIRSNGFIFTSGQLPMNPDTGSFPDNIEDQARQCLNNLEGIAFECSVNLSDAVKISIYLKDINDFEAMNKVYSTYFKDPFPARVTSQVAVLPLNAGIEIDAIIPVHSNIKEI